MRKHSLRRSYSSQHLIISDSQLRDLSFPNCNILSISGGIISDVAQLHIPQDVTLLALFIGANNAFTRNGLPTSQTPLEIARELSKLADTLCEKISKVYVFALPPRHSQPERTKAVNSALEKLQRTSRWLFRGLSKYIYNEDQLRSDNVHIQQKALGGFKRVLRHKVLRKNFSVEIDKQGHLDLIQCSNHCFCGFFLHT